MVNFSDRRVLLMIMANVFFPLHLKLLSTSIPGSQLLLAIATFWRHHYKFSSVQKGKTKYWKLWKKKSVWLFLRLLYQELVCNYREIRETRTRLITDCVFDIFLKSEAHIVVTFVVRSDGPIDTQRSMRWHYSLLRTTLPSQRVKGCLIDWLCVLLLIMMSWY